MQQEIGWAIDWAHGNGHQGFVPELRGYTGLLRLQKMAETDETIGAMLWVMVSTICQVPWSFTPCINGMEVSQDDPEYDQANAAAAFCESTLTDMDHSWSDHLEEAITMAWAGFAPCEINFKKRDGVDSKFDDGKWGFASLPLRDQHTIWDWETDPATNKLTKMKQRTIDGKAGDIPIWKLLHYRMSRVLDNPWGKSMLTNAYRPFYLKQRIQESEAIGIDREMAGMPTMRVPNSEIALANKKDASGKPTKEALEAKQRIQASIDAVTKMRFNEVGGLVLPSDVYLDEDGKPSSIKKWDFSIITSAGQRAIDARTAARDYDRAIARTVLMQFLHLGERSGGSYGLSEDQSSMAIRSMKWVAGKIANEFNLKAMPLLWLMNAMPKKFMPKLVSGDVKEESIAILGQFLESMAMADILFADDPALKDAVFERAGLTASRRKFKDVPSKPRPAPAQAQLPLPGGGGPAKPPSAKRPAVAGK